MASKRGRPRAFAPEDVLPHAFQTFVRHGYAGASVDALAESMGLAKPSLYAAFGTKRELFQRVIEEAIARLSKRFGAALRRGDTLEGALRELFLEAVDVYVDEQPGCVMASAAVTEAATDPELAAFSREFFERTDRALAAALAHYTAENAPALARIANSVIHDIALRGRVGESKTKLRAFARESAQLLSSSRGAGSRD